jgi:hypothetical protein
MRLLLDAHTRLDMTLNALPCGGPHQVNAIEATMQGIAAEREALKRLALTRPAGSLADVAVLAALAFEDAELAVAPNRESQATGTPAPELLPTLRSNLASIVHVTAAAAGLDIDAVTYPGMATRIAAFVPLHRVGVGSGDGYAGGVVPAHNTQEGRGP